MPVFVLVKSDLRGLKHMSKCGEITVRMLKSDLRVETFLTLETNWKVGVKSDLRGLKHAYRRAG